MNEIVKQVTMETLSLTAFCTRMSNLLIETLQIANEEFNDDTQLRSSLIGSEGSCIDVNSEEGSHSLKRKLSSETRITIVPEKQKPINQSPLNTWEHCNTYMYHMR